MGVVGLVAVVDLQNLGGVFERHFVGPAEIGEHVIPRPVAARSPLDRVAMNEAFAGVGGVEPVA